MVLLSIIHIFITTAYPVGMTQLAADGIMVEVDQYCACMEVTNNGTKDVMLSHNSALQWNSFINSGHASDYPTMDVTGCSSVYINAPGINFTDINTSACMGTTDTQSTWGMGNSPTGGNYYLQIAGTISSCTVYSHMDGVSTILAFPAVVNACQNGQWRLSLDCPGSGAKTGTITIRRTSHVGAIRDTVNITVNSFGTNCAI